MPTPSSPSPLLPPPAPHASSASRRRRRLLASTHPSSSSAPNSAAASSSSSYSSSSSASSNPPFFSPAPSPFHHRFLSPLRASAVPFSWEHRPGIPKTPARAPRCAKTPGPGAKPSPSPPLPLPPSLFSTNSNRVVAEHDYSVGPEKKARRRCRRTPPQRRWPAVADALGDWLAVLSLYRSCTKSRDCLAPAGPPPRPRPRAPA